MSYTPTEWKTGDVITADKLNNMESGILRSAKVLFVELNTETRALDKTWIQIAGALSDRLLCLLVVEGGNGAGLSIINAAYQVGTQYNVYFNFETVETATVIATAESANDYPILDGR